MEQINRVFRFFSVILEPALIPIHILELLLYQTQIPAKPGTVRMLMEGR